MILKCDNTWKAKLLTYVGDKYVNCLYLYMDLIKYGLNKAFISVWVDLNSVGEIKCIVFRYYTGIHIFSKNDKFDMDGVIKIIRKIHPQMINSTRKIIQVLEPYLDNEYKVDYGCVKSIVHGKFDVFSEVKSARIKDIPAMAVMLCSDEGIGGSYSIKDMETQLMARMRDNYTRSYVIYSGEKIVAQASTSAEIDTLAVISDVIVDIEYRGRGLAKKLLSVLCNDLIPPKEVFLVCYNPIADRFYEKFGFKTRVEWGKLYLKRNNDALSEEMI